MTILSKALDRIPVMFVKECGYVPSVLFNAEVFIERCMNTPELFQVQGCSQKVNHVLCQMSAPGAVNNFRNSNYSVHDVIEAVKMFLVKLPEPLLSDAVCDALIEASQVEDNLGAILSDLKAAQPAHFSILHFMIRLLAKVADPSNQNGMDVRKLATIFVLDVLKPLKRDDGTDVPMFPSMQMKKLPYLIMVVERLIDNLHMFKMGSSPVMSKCEGISPWENQSLNPSPDRDIMEKTIKNPKVVDPKLMHNKIHTKILARGRSRLTTKSRCTSAPPRPQTKSSSPTTTPTTSRQNLEPPAPQAGREGSTSSSDKSLEAIEEALALSPHDFANLIKPAVYCEIQKEHLHKPAVSADSLKERFSQHPEQFHSMLEQLINDQRAKHSEIEKESCGDHMLNGHVINDEYNDPKLHAYVDVEKEKKDKSRKKLERTCNALQKLLKDSIKTKTPTTPVERLEPAPADRSKEDVSCNTSFILEDTELNPDLKQHEQKKDFDKPKAKVNTKPDSEKNTPRKLSPVNWAKVGKSPSMKKSNETPKLKKSPVLKTLKGKNPPSPKVRKTKRMYLERKSLSSVELSKSKLPKAKVGSRPHSVTKKRKSKKGKTRLDKASRASSMCSIGSSDHVAFRPEEAITPWQEMSPQSDNIDISVMNNTIRRPRVMEDIQVKVSSSRDSNHASPPRNAPSTYGGDPMDQGDVNQASPKPDSASKKPPSPVARRSNHRRQSVSPGRTSVSPGRTSVSPGRTSVSPPRHKPEANRCDPSTVKVEFERDSKTGGKHKSTRSTSEVSRQEMYGFKPEVKLDMIPEVNRAPVRRRARSQSKSPSVWSAVSDVSKPPSPNSQHRKSRQPNWGRTHNETPSNVLKQKEEGWSNWYDKKQDASDPNGHENVDRKFRSASQYSTSGVDESEDIVSPSTFEHFKQKASDKAVSKVKLRKNDHRKRELLTDEYLSSNSISYLEYNQISSRGGPTTRSMKHQKPEHSKAKLSTHAVLCHNKSLSHHDNKTTGPRTPPNDESMQSYLSGISPSENTSLRTNGRTSVKSGKSHSRHHSLQRSNDVHNVHSCGQHNAALMDDQGHVCEEWSNMEGPSGSDNLQSISVHTHPAAVPFNIMPNSCSLSSKKGQTINASTSFERAKLNAMPQGRQGGPDVNRPSSSKTSHPASRLSDARLHYMDVSDSVSNNQCNNHGLSSRTASIAAASRRVCQMALYRDRLRQPSGLRSPRPRSPHDLLDMCLLAVACALAGFVGYSGVTQHAWTG